MAERVAFIGLGIMGSRMAAVLRRAGHDIAVWNRTRETSDAWVEQHGGRVAATPREAAEGADAVISIVVDGPQVEQVLLGDDGAVHGAPDDTLFVDMTTIAPADARKIGTALNERGHAFLDAPVTGGKAGAENGTLTIMVGGEEPAFARARPLLEAMGELILHVGPSGQGQIVKVISNAVSATNCATLAQALVVGRAAGVDVEALVQVMANGSANSTMLALKAEPMLTHDYAPLFKLEHMLKDVRLALEEGRTAGAPFPSAALAHELYVAALARGHGADDFAAVLEAVEGLAGVRL